MLTEEIRYFERGIHRVFPLRFCFFLALSIFDSWTCAAGFNLLAVFVVGVWAGLRAPPEESAGLAVVVLGVFRITQRAFRLGGSAKQRVGCLQNTRYCLIYKVRKRQL